MFLTNWPSVWAMTGVGIGIVFVILLLLVLVLQIFTLLAVKKAPAGVVQGIPASDPAASKVVNEDEEEMAAAIAAALFMESEEAHDQESGIITIVHNDHSAWHHVK